VIFTQEQAGRGQSVYQAACVACHSADLRGNSNAPSLLGMSFMFLWEGRSVGELFTNIRTQMPSENPNSLPAQSYLDVLAFILQANSFPAGTSELTADLEQLNVIGIVAEPVQ
jgi:cytochrome c